MAMVKLPAACAPTDIFRPITRQQAASVVDKEWHRMHTLELSKHELFSDKGSRQGDTASAIA